MSVLGRAIAVALSTKGNNFVFRVSYSTGAVDLRAQALSAGWDGTKRVVAVVLAGTIICPQTTGGWGANGNAGISVTGSFPNGVKLQIQPGASVGGSQGASAVQGIGAQNGGNGGAGGTGLYTTVPLTVDNRGTIAGAGGGGAGGAGALKPDLSILQGGGGGNGQDLFFAAGSGGSGDVGYGGTYAGGGGSGGSFGSGGNTGTGSVSWDVWPGGYSPGTPGAGGLCISGNSNITWENTGTRYGTIA